MKKQTKETQNKVVGSCFACGQEIKIGWRFCPYCSYKISKKPKKK